MHFRLLLRNSIGIDHFPLPTSDSAERRRRAARISRSRPRRRDSLDAGIRARRAASVVRLSSAHFNAASGRTSKWRADSALLPLTRAAASRCPRAADVARGPPPVFTSSRFDVRYPALLPFSRQAAAGFNERARLCFAGGGIVCGRVNSVAGVRSFDVYVRCHWA